VLAYIIAFCAILTGVLEIVAAVRLRRVIRNEWALIVGGALSVVFGVVVAAALGAGALALVWLIDAYAVVFGITLIAVSWRVRSHAQRVRGAEPTGRLALP
jgi:uncharacterized membrane protein HdeD (DUF308 family)